MGEQNQKDTRIEVEFDGPLEVKPFDVSPHIGTRAKIETVTTHYNQSRDSYYLRVATGAVAYLDEEKQKPVVASRLYALMQQDGKFGWRQGGDLDLFLKSHKVSAPQELVGKEVIVIATPPNKDGARFLTFN